MSINLNKIPQHISGEQWNEITARISDEQWNGFVAWCKTQWHMWRPHRSSVELWLEYTHQSTKQEHK